MALSLRHFSTFGVMLIKALRVGTSSQFFTIALHLRSLLTSIRLPSEERGLVQVLIVDAQSLVLEIE